MNKFLNKLLIKINQYMSNRFKTTESKIQKIFQRVEKFISAIFYVVIEIVSILSDLLGKIMYLVISLPLIIIAESVNGISKAAFSIIDQYSRKFKLYAETEEEYNDILEREKKKAQRFIIISKNLLTGISILSVLILAILVISVPKYIESGLVFNLIEIIVYGSFLGAITCSIAVANFKTKSRQQ